jgi:hypothetical protein
MEKAKVKMVRNEHGVNIKKCCASCGNKGLGKNDGRRICIKGEGEVPADYLCEDWLMNQQCKNIRSETFGMVKKPAYIAWLKKQVDEINARDITEAQGLTMLASMGIDTAIKTNAGLRAKMALITALPKQYEKEFGSRYLGKK